MIVYIAQLILFFDEERLKDSPLMSNLGFNGAETNCGIAHILGILLSCNTDIFFSNYYHLQSVRFELFRNDVVAKVGVVTA